MQNLLSSIKNIYSQTNVIKRESTLGYKYHHMLHIGILLIVLLTAQFVYAKNDSIVLNRESAELCLETASTLEEALNYLDQTVDMSLMSDIETLHDFSTALQKDIKMSTEKRFSILTSNTLERIGNFGLGKIPDVVDVLKTTGKLPSSFNLPATLGRRNLLPQFQDILAAARPILIRLPITLMG